MGFVASHDPPADRRSEPLTRQLHCRACGRAVSVRYEAAYRPGTVAVWVCPYEDCGRDVLALSEVRGDQLATWAGHGPEPTK